MKFLWLLSNIFLLTRLLRGATFFAEYLTDSAEISTHAPLARRDFKESKWIFVPDDFYSRASCEARPRKEEIMSVNTNFYSRASCEARPMCQTVLYGIIGISTHAPLARRDRTNKASIVFGRRFLLTRLLRGATGARRIYPPPYFISTHAPLARRD